MDPFLKFVSSLLIAFGIKFIASLVCVVIFCFLIKTIYELQYGLTDWERVLKYLLSAFLCIFLILTLNHFLEFSSAAMSELKDLKDLFLSVLPNHENPS